jgi:hypothetical protein
MTKDQAYMVKRLAAAFGPAHFGLAKAHRAVMPKRSAAWIPFDSDELLRDMKRLVRAGLAADSTGPRGGAGWTLTSEALLKVGAGSTATHNAEVSGA